MALSDVWARTLVYFGIAEEEDWDDDGYLTEDELAEEPNVRRFPARSSRHDDDDDWTDPEPDAQRTSILRPRSAQRPVRNLQPVQAPGACTGWRLRVRRDSLRGRRMLVRCASGSGSVQSSS